LQYNVCLMVTIYIYGRQNKDKRHDRTIISINTLNDIMAVKRGKSNSIGLKFDKICGLTGSPSIDQKEWKHKQKARILQTNKHLSSSSPSSFFFSIRLFSLFLSSLLLFLFFIWIRRLNPLENLLSHIALSFFFFMIDRSYN
jgi:hypothetical protein